MSWARVQHIDNEASSQGVSLSLSMPGASTTGNLFVVCVCTNGSPTVTVSLSDNSGLNTWTQIGTYATNTGNRVSLWYAKNITGTASPSLSITASGAVTISADWVEYSGLDTTAPLDGSASATGSSTSADTGAVTVSASNELLFCGMSDTPSGTTITAGTGFTGITNKPSAVEPIATEEQSVSANTHGTFTLGSSVGWAIIAASFKIAAGGGGSRQQTSTLLGCGA